MNKKNEKGFALVLSLVMLMAMSLMGGALIVISASDHQSNNISDEYQQTFYVAETALIEGEKYLLNQFKGPYDSNGDRDLSKSGIQNLNNGSVIGSPHASVEKCFNSFSDIDRTTFQGLFGPPPNNPTSSSKIVVYHDGLYSDFITDNIINHDLDSADKKTEKNRLNKFRYQYFLTQIGPAEFKGSGESIKAGPTDSGKDGMAYRIFGCGVFDDDKIVVPLESIMILPQ